MKLVKGILLLHLSSICRALFNSTTQVPLTNSSVAPDGNFTQLEDDVNDNPFVDSLSSKCHWTLKMPENSSLEDVAVDAELVDRLALQICQELGCGGVYDLKKIKYPTNSSCFSECYYKTGTLQNCSLRETQDCVVISEAKCGAHMVRLSGGQDRCAGRVDLWRGGRWGSVCDDEFDLAEAEVVCRQVGCGYALNVSGQGGMFPPGRGPVLLDNLNCTGTEPNLWECPATEETDCGHKEDAGVVCSEMKAVRLSGGLDRCSGNVEIHRNGTWGTVCDNCWNKDIASMICSMLQCDPFPQKYTQFTPRLIHNPGPLYYYYCPLSSTGLWDCREFVNNKNLCKDSHASGVICNGSLGFQVPTTANPSVTTDPNEMVTEVYQSNSSLLSSLPLLALAAVSMLLLVFLTVTSVLCCHYKSRLAFLVQQSHTSQSSKSKQRRNSYEDLTKVSVNPAQDYDSQRHKAVRNPLMRTPGLDGLRVEEASEPVQGELGAFSNCNGANPPPITFNSFDTSSTSSEETYKSTSVHSEEQPYKEEDEEPLYSPVSPETDSSIEDDDYDDVDTPGHPAKPGLIQQNQD